MKKNFTSEGTTAWETAREKFHCTACLTTLTRARICSLGLSVASASLQTLAQQSANVVQVELKSILKDLAILFHEYLGVMELEGNNEYYTSSRLITAYRESTK